jgi:hypothetical protein
VGRDFDLDLAPAPATGSEEESGDERKQHD